LIASQGDLAKGAELATAVIEETYYTSYVAHAAMEPHAALAKIDDGKATIWASTQNPFMLKPQLAWAIRVPAEDIRVITPFLGGGFGGKAFNQQAVEAARLAKAAGVPVQVSWSRDEEFFYDTPRPAAVVKIKSGVDAAGKIVLWDYRVHFAGERGAAHFYDIAHHATVSDDGDFGGRTNAHALRIGAWRGVGCSTNTFGRESQIDNMAAKAGMDPVEFRLKNLKDERMLGVLKAAAEKFAWTPQKAPSGRGVGVACGIDAGTYVALMAEVDVDRDTGRVKVKRILCAQDMGLVVNPQGATIQMEGCLMMGLGYALTEEVHFQGGDVLDRDFRAYEIPKFSWLPKIETVLISAKNTWPRGGGEPAVVGVGAVIGNALFDAIGVRMRQLPMTAERVKEALAKR
jgi:isoquinoline 1-oxidoreductase